MKLIVGLGNPGKEYEKTRHNVGFNAIDTLAKDWGEYNTAKRSNKLYEAGEYELVNGSAREMVVLVKPLTFMNRSGEVVRQLVKKYEGKLNIASDLIVINDELDVLSGQVKIDHGSSSAGHNGVQNIIDQLGTKDFTRIRIGIRPENGISMPVEDFVLRKFSTQEQGNINEVLSVFPELVQILLEKGLGEAQTRYNRKTISK